jgi:hypothetical protein
MSQSEEANKVMTALRHDIDARLMSLAVASDRKIEALVLMKLLDAYQSAAFSYAYAADLDRPGAAS